jgi:hypothetical protein
VTLLQPRKKKPVVVSTLNRGEPPWHWLVLASVNEADWNVWPLRPVMSAPAAAFVDVGQFFSRCNVFVFLTNVALTQPVLPGSNTPGTSAADAETVKASAVARTPAIRNFFMVWSPCRSVLQHEIFPALPFPTRGSTRARVGPTTSR